jgi:hypothetical protein
MSERTSDDDRSFELFELVTAVLLGLSTIGSAVASIQSGQWGGKQLEAFAEANAITTDASRSYGRAVSNINSDYAVVGQAKRLILEGIDATSDADQLRSYKLASYYLTQQLEDAAYEAMNLPAAPNDASAGDASAGDDSTGDASTGDASMTEEEVEAKMSSPLSEAALIEVLGRELHDDDRYENVMFADGNRLFEAAGKKFEDGRHASATGDQFELVGFYYTVALFLAGLGLIFKTRTRWWFISLGYAVFLLSTAYLFTRAWA